jgi:hypothetical protein
MDLNVVPTVPSIKGSSACTELIGTLERNEFGEK